MSVKLRRRDVGDLLAGLGAFLGLVPVALLVLYLPVAMYREGNWFAAAVVLYFYLSAGLLVAGFVLASGDGDS